MMRSTDPRPSSRLSPLLSCGLLLLLLVNGIHQQSEDPVAWRQSTLRKLQSEVANSTTEVSRNQELRARFDWLSRWQPGAMTDRPSSLVKLPAKRKEPLLESAPAGKLRKRLASMSVDQAAERLPLALQAPDCDIACLQAILHWLDDDPTRRKQFLDEVEQVTARLIGALEDSAAEDADETLEIVLDFARYRRARALAYRELPDVIAENPIADPAEQDRQLQAAFEDLLQNSGRGRPEFILLEIRMHRRAQEYGQALRLLETYGSTLLPKWYQKKRRDLLEELGWVYPHREAATIYQQNFPDEVEKERQFPNSDPRQP